VVGIVRSTLVEFTEFTIRDINSILISKVIPFREREILCQLMRANDNRIYLRQRNLIDARVFSHWVDRSSRDNSFSIKYANIQRCSAGSPICFDDIPILCDY